MEVKKCSMCGEVKSVDMYSKIKSKNNKLASRCKQCQVKAVQKCKDPEKTKVYDKEYVSRPKTKEKRAKYREEHKEELEQYFKEYREEIKNDPIKREKKNAYQRQYREKHKEKLNKESRDKRKTPIERLKHSIDINIRRAFKWYSKNGKTKSKNKYGIDYEDIIHKIGLKKNDNLQMDHIIPQIVFNFDNPGHVFLCQHPENLRWLEESENSSKQDKIDWSLIEGNIFLEAICLELGITKEDDGLDGRDIRVILYEQDK